MKKNYEVGDKVYIKSIEWYNKNKSGGSKSSVINVRYHFVWEMSKYCGKKATIIYKNGKCFNIDLDGKVWSWSKKMFYSIKKIRKRKLNKIQNEKEI